MKHATIPEEMRPRAQGKCVFSPNPVLDRILRTPIFLPHIIYMPVVVFMFVYGILEKNNPFLQSIVFFCGGWLAWTLVEYTVHRFLYHTTFLGSLLNRLRDRAHWMHHRHPKDPYCLAMPPLMSAILGTAFFFLFYLVLADMAFPFFSGFMWGYLYYLLIHYYQHKISKPHFLKKLHAHHVIHHYIEPNSNFGVSTRLWDIIFGTLYRKNSGKTVS